MFDTALEFGAIDVTGANDAEKDINLAVSHAGDGPAKTLYVNVYATKDFVGAVGSDFQLTLLTDDDAAFGSAATLGQSKIIATTAGAAPTAGTPIWSFALPPWGETRSRLRISTDKLAANYPAVGNEDSLHAVIDCHPAHPTGLGGGGPFAGSGATPPYGTTG